MRAVVPVASLRQLIDKWSGELEDVEKMDRRLFSKDELLKVPHHMLQLLDEICQVSEAYWADERNPQ